MSPARRVFAQVLLAGVFVMDGYDLNAMPLAVPHLEGALGLPPASFGIVFSAVLIGMGVLVARVGAIGGPLIGQYLLSQGAEPRIFLLAAAGPAILCAVVCLALPAALRVRVRQEA